MKKIIFLCCFYLLAASLISNAQCYEYYGYSSEGGRYNAGAFYKADANGNVMIFKDLLKYEGRWPMADLCEADNHKLYGVVNTGGNNNEGFIFEWDPQTKGYEKKIDFLADSTGKYVRSELLNTSNGKLYGMTNAGGEWDLGALFEYDPVTNIFRKILDFDGLQNGSKPNGSLIQAENGKLYGMTTEGGANDCGIIFEYDPESGVFSKEYDLISEWGKNPYGSFCEFSHKLYGMTKSGGASDFGVIFEWDPVLHQYHRKFEFSGNNGKNPEGSLTAGENGTLYGTTYAGGTKNSGVIFGWDPVLNDDTVYFNFSNSGSNGSLLRLSGGSFLGRTANYIFEWEPQEDTITIRTGLPGSVAFPSRGSLIQASNNLVYGCSMFGGIPDIRNNYDYGTLFEYDPVNDTLKILVKFQDAPDGAYPGSMVQADNGNFYGVALKGGSYNFGILYELNPENGKYSKLFDFDWSVAYPINLVKGKNGLLYGYSKGDIEVNEAWNLFGFDPQSHNFYKYIEGSIYYHGLSSRYPNALVEADTNTFYMSFGSGEIFKWIAGEDHFSDTLILGKSARLFSYENGKIYGIYNGAANEKFVFEIDTGSFVTVNNQSTDNDFYISSMIAGENNKVYGLARQNQTGTLWEWDPGDHVITKKIQVDMGTSSHIFGNLVKNPTGIHGFILLDDYEKHFAYFEVNPGENLYNKVFDMKWPSTGYPDGVPEMVKRSLSANITARACDEFVSPSGRVLTESGLYYDTVVSHWGCDSVIATHLTIVKSTASSLDIITNESYLSPTGKIWSVSGNYSDTIPNNAGCDSVISIHLTIEEATGIDHNTAAEVSLYPNPSTGSFAIDLGTPYGRASLNIKDLNGRSVRYYTFSKSRSMNISSGLQPGVYLGLIRYGNNCTVVRILVE